MTNPPNSRGIALEMILEILEKGTLSHLALRNGLEKWKDLDRRDRAFITRMTEGTVERQITLDYVINQYASTPVKKMKPFIRGLLRMSVYQILFMDGVPDSAVCNEAVKLAGKRGFQGLKGFVNGTLRRIAGEKDRISYPPLSTIEGLSVRYSCPEWIIAEWVDRYGREITQKMLEETIKDRPLLVHVNHSGEKSPECLASELREKGIEIHPHPYREDAWMLEGIDRLEILPAFLEGEIQPQDISSQISSLLAVRALEEQREKETLLVLDVCAAPGGKSLYTADGAKAEKLPVQVIARDLTEEKVRMIRENTKRCKLENLTSEVWDATQSDDSKVGQVDVLIADLPCSGMGIMGRKNDIKYHVTRESREELVQLQRQILDVVSAYVKPGGYLLYSTCTINPAENEENFRYLTDLPGFVPVDLTGWLPEEVVRISGEQKEKNTEKQGYLQLLPGVYDSDGFFVSVCKREVR